jgi:hypothetical protein
MPLVILISALFLAPCSSHGQDRQWEQVMEQGNTAHAAGDIYTAETHFRMALDIARQFPIQDLRSSTTQRNLAQVLALQGRYTDADTLYRTAIGIALLSLDDTHPYVLSLKDELAQLKAAESGDEPPEVEPPQSEGSIAEFLYRLEKWLAMHTTLHLGASLPLIGNLQQSNEQGFYYGLDFHIPLLTLGPLSTTVRLGFNSMNLPGKHSLDEPLKLEGPAAMLAPAVGPLIFTFGAGYYNVYTRRERTPQLAMFGGAGFEIWKKRLRRRGIHLQPVLYLGATQLTESVANQTEAPTIIQAALTLGLK